MTLASGCEHTYGRSLWRDEWRKGALFTVCEKCKQPLYFRKKLDAQGELSLVPVKELPLMLLPRNMPEGVPKENFIPDEWWEKRYGAEPRSIGLEGD